MTTAATTAARPVASTMMDDELSLNHLLERAGRLFGESVIVSRLPDKSLVRHTYAQWYQRTRALAAALQGLGIAKGDRVATLCWNHHAHLEAYFAVPAAGAVLHTLNLRLAPAEIGWIAADGGARVLVVDDILLPLYRQFAHLHRFEHVVVFPFSGAPVDPEFHDYERLLAQADGEGFRYVPHFERDPVAMCYTSGTTGQPKGVVYSHRSALLHTFTASLPDYWDLRGVDVVLPVTPMFHANSWGIPYGAVMLGCKMVFPGPHLHAEDLMDLMTEEQPTFSLGVPTIWLGIAQTYAAAQEPSHPHHGRWRLPRGMRSIVGGAAVPESLIRALDALGLGIVQGWGMTETSPLATVSYIKPELAGASPDERYRRTAMAGVPLPLVRLRLQRDDGTLADWDGKSPGEIQVRGPYVTGAYAGVGSPPDKFTSDGWLRTGDVGTCDAHGYVRLTDRTKDLIKSGGEWISSVDLENALMAHPAVAEAAVIAIPDEKWSERPLACVAFRPQRSAEPAELLAHLAQHGFAKWQLPDRYEIVEAIPKTATGKFWKVRLREMFPR
ncbi:long-chain-fatty-acid--CoA ligase [Ramlibacter sp.]|uniref:long-chain-fatty-acid--CoA ligase n=1 Tax=Ramlibacter sp. TaxID=1917967 RepID=UPI003D0C3E57